MIVRRTTWTVLSSSRFRSFQPAKIQKGFHEVCTVFHLKAFACLGDLKTQKVYCVAFMSQHHHICLVQTGLHVFKIAHELFVWSLAHHVIHVTQEDRIFRRLCTFLHVRRRIRYQLVVAHVVDFLCAVNTPSHAHTWLLPRQPGACPSSCNLVPTSCGWLQRRCRLPQGSTQSAEGLHRPCTRSQTEVGGTTTSIFACSRCGESRPRDSRHILHQGWLRKFARLCCSITIRSGVPGSLSVAGRASIGPSTSSSICG